MTLVKKPIGRVPQSFGNWSASFINPKTQLAGYGKKFRANLYGCEFESLMENNTNAPMVWDGSETFTEDTVHWRRITGSPEAWIEGQDKPATSEQYPYNGMGRVVLKKNMVNGVNTLTQDMFYKGEAGIRVPNTNTTYVIQYDFTLASDVTIPANCVLEFDGGSIAGVYSIIGTNTQIKAQDVAIFNSGITIAGSWNCPRIVSDWFSDITQENRLKQLVNLSNSNIHNTIVIGYGTYNVSVPVNGGRVFDVNSNTDIILLGTIQLLPNNFTNSYIFNIRDCVDVSISGCGKIIGDRDGHTGTAGEWGHGIYIIDSNNVTVEGIEVNKCWGDSIYIGSDIQGTPSGINIKRCRLHNSRRQGISVESADGVNIEDCFISEINGTLPKSGIDVEPNVGGSTVMNVIIKGCTITSCADGIHSYCPNDSVLKNIRIYNNTITGNTSLAANIRTIENVIIEGNIISGELQCYSSVKNVVVSKNVFNNFTVKLGGSKFIDNIGRDGGIMWLGAGVVIKDNELELTSPINTPSGGGIIKNNQIIVKGPYGIIVSHDDSIIVDNILKDVETGNGCILIKTEEGTNCEISGNRLTTVNPNSIKCNPYNAAYFENKQYRNFGTTAERPTLPIVSSANPALIDVSIIGFRYFDTDLKKPIYWSGNNTDGWVDATGTPV